MIRSLPLGVIPRICTSVKLSRLLSSAIKFQTQNPFLIGFALKCQFSKPQPTLIHLWDKKSVLCFLLTVFIILLCASKQMPKAWKHFFVWNLDCQEFAIASWHSKFEVEDISAMLSVIMVSKMLSSVWEMDWWRSGSNNRVVIEYD